MARNDGGSAKKTGEARRAASEKHDEQFFTDRKAKEASNLEKTMRLKAQRLAHEATQPKAPKKPTKKTGA